MAADHFKAQNPYQPNIPRLLGEELRQWRFVGLVAVGEWQIGELLDFEGWVVDVDEGYWDSSLVTETYKLQFVFAAYGNCISASATEALE